MKTASFTLRSSARQLADAQFTSFYRPPARQHDKSQAMPALGRRTTLDAASLADLKVAVRRGLRGLVSRPEMAREYEA